MERRISVRRVAAVTVASLLGVALLGGAAIAAFGPAMPGRAVAALPGVGPMLAEHRGPHAPFGDLLGAALDYIGITREELMTGLQAGSSLADIAVANGKTRDGLIAAMTASGEAAIDQAAANGRITSERAASMKADLAQKVERMVDATGPFKMLRGHGPGPLHVGLDAAVEYLGISAEDLRTRLAAGETLAQIADSTPGKSREGLIAALTDAARTKIEGFVDRTFPARPGR